MLRGERQKTWRGRLVAAFAVTGVLAVSGIALAAPGDVMQTVNVAVSPDQLPAKDHKNVELQVDVSACYEDTTPDCRGEAPQVPDLSGVEFGFDRKDIAFNPDAAKRCKAGANQIADRTPEEAEEACGRQSVVGRGFAILNNGQSIEPGAVTVINGKPQGGRPVVLLHAYFPDSGRGTVPVGVLKPGNKLDVQVPPLDGPATLQTLTTAIKKGKYVQARCTRGQRITTTSRWTYRDAPNERVTATQPCEVRK